jgi:hypothetical protein
MHDLQDGDVVNIVNEVKVLTEAVNFFNSANTEGINWNQVYIDMQDTM